MVSKDRFMKGIAMKGVPNSNPKPLGTKEYITSWPFQNIRFYMTSGDVMRYHHYQIDEFSGILEGHPISLVVSAWWISNNLLGTSEM